MPLTPQSQPNGHAHPNIDLINPNDIIDHMIDLRCQMAQLEHQIQTLKPAFFAACHTLGRKKIQHQHAIITQRLTPAQWNYAPNILEQQDRLKTLKQQFQKDHEPISGRDLIWIIQLLITHNQSPHNPPSAQTPTSNTHTDPLPTN